MGVTKPNHPRLQMKNVAETNLRMGGTPPPLLLRMGSVRRFLTPSLNTQGPMHDPYSINLQKLTVLSVICVTTNCLN